MFRENVNDERCSFGFSDEVQGTGERRYNIAHSFLIRVLSHSTHGILAGIGVGSRVRHMLHSAQNML
jgi:hypothetical protein